jgi:hypothetical protein
MRNRNKAGAPLLFLLALPTILVACNEGSDPTYPVLETPQFQMVLRPEAVSLIPGERIQLDALLLEEGEEIIHQELGVVWESSDENVVRPLGGGWIEALKPGNAFVRVNYRGWRAEARISVAGEARLVRY